MNARKLIGVLSMMALLMGMMVIPAAAETNTIVWGGQGSNEIDDDCVGYHWIFSPGGGVTDVRFYSSEDDGEPMVQKGASGQGAWHYDSGADIALEIGTTPYVTYVGDAHPAANLRISHCIPGDVPFDPEGTLSVDKTAFGEWDREVEWELTKTVNGEESVHFDGAPGDTFDVDWEVSATKIETGPENFRIYGEVTVGWEGNYTATVELTDSLDDGTLVELDCGDDGSGLLVTLVLEDGDQVECTYEVLPDDASAETNTAVGDVVAGVGVGAFEGEPVPFEDLPEPVEDEQDILWEENLTGDDEVTLGDERFEYEELIDSSTTENFPEEFECSTDPGDYTNGTYDQTHTNTATLVGDNTDLEASAEVTITCVAPFVGDTVTGDGLKWHGTVSGSPNTWFEYSPYEETSGTLIQGRPRNNVGSFTAPAMNTAGELCFALAAPYTLADVGSNVKIQPLDAQPKKYLQPGKFALHFTESGSDFCVDVPAAEYGYAIHLDAGYHDFG